MSDVTKILSRIEQGDKDAADELLPLVYDELRKLATARMVRENPGQTLQATGLVHEAYIRLVEASDAQHWDSRGHFFASAAEAMRRILVERARHKQREKHGGGWNRLELNEVADVAAMPPGELLSLSDAIDSLSQHDPAAAELVKLKCFAGLSIPQAAKTLGISRSNAYRQWTYAKAWLLSRVGEGGVSP